MRSLKLFIGSGFGSGLIPFAPGTWGSLLSLVPVYFLINTGNIFLVPLFVVVTSLLSLWVTSACVEQWGDDPGKLVMDEWAGQALTFISISSTGVLDSDLMILGFGFILFRIFDILKPLGINKLQKYGGGSGILLDDLLAGLYALICLKSLIFFLS
ncbi:MAG: phosphatidylglycerophosphatase A [Balneola sp.]|nr:phosphatidylglycerophosphatase A [Balneola sp.]MBO6651532.1 phosphatidylglycerophosphatase A [Balneola sp.]MBO6710258.1 phosphatidylglycerophosphatase A [Balneola sp.]MBO6798943.1 phosphatidylglycerophosphatase A [Balneola sp.]MBO6870057.1 phosphatidylglycerophosphatase A [Balneola sp.]